MDQLSLGRFRIGKRARRGRKRSDGTWNDRAGCNIVSGDAVVDRDREASVNWERQLPDVEISEPPLQLHFQPARQLNRRSDERRGLNSSFWDDRAFESSESMVHGEVLHTSSHMLDEDHDHTPDDAELLHGFQDIGQHSFHESDANGPMEDLVDEFDAIAEYQPQTGDSDQTVSTSMSTNDGQTQLSNECLSRIRARMKKICKWPNLLAFLSLNGSGRLSVDQYNEVQVVMNVLITKCFGDRIALPAYSTVRRTMIPFLRDYAFVESFIQDVPPRDPSVAVPTSFIIVSPSSWSSMEVSFKPTWDILKQAALQTHGNADPVFSVIESVPMVVDKDNILDVQTAIIPTERNESEPPSPLLLIPRCSQPCLTLRVRGMPPFPRAVIAAMNAVNDTETNYVSLKVRCVVSVMVGMCQEGETDGDVSLMAQAGEITSGTFAALRVPIINLWRAGDVCTLLEPSMNTNHIAVLVQQHLRRAERAQEMELCCIPYEKTNDTTTESFRFQFHRSSRKPVSAIATSSLTADAPHSTISSVVAQPGSFGRLNDGSLFFVDHILLYSDGFSQYNFKQGSAGGVYALSLNYPPALRKSRERVRVLALTPPGISTMQGLRAVIDDLVKASTMGVKVRNADGDEMILFTDIVGYVGDYLETSHALDILGQNGRAPCHLCAFQRFKGHPSSASRYAYTTEISSSDTCYSRMWERTDSIRKAGIADEDLLAVGLNRAVQAEGKNSPLIELSQKLKEARKANRIPLTMEGKPVVNPRFDPYRSVLVSPDHVLFGVSTNSLNFAFAVLQTNERRKQADVMICDALRLNGLPNETQVYNFNTATVHAASISMRFATILVAPAIFSEVIENCEQNTDTTRDIYFRMKHGLANLTRLRDLISATYWFPDVIVDGMDAVREFNMNSGRERMAKLERMAEDYVKGVNLICRSYADARTELDKPNVHRVLELYKHSIPSMGHVRHFAELIFETAHQPLKRAMQKSNFRQAHLQSSWTAIADDWKRRFQSVLNVPAGEAGEQIKKKELLSLLCRGRKEIFDFLSADDEFMTDLSAVMSNELIRSHLNYRPSALNMKLLRNRWICTMPSTRTTEQLEVLDNVVELAKNLLLEEDARTVTVYERATRVRILEFNGHAAPGKYSDIDLIQEGSVVQAFVEDTKAALLTPFEGGEGIFGETGYYVVRLLMGFQARSDSLNRELENISCCYAAVNQCELKGDLLSVCSTAESVSDAQILTLTDGVRRVGVVHACQKDQRPGCFPTSCSARKCEASVIQGHKFYYFGKKEGYPPRMA